MGKFLAWLNNLVLLLVDARDVNGFGDEAVAAAQSIRQRETEEQGEEPGKRPPAG